MGPAVVLGLLAGMGGHVPRVVVVGCQPLTLAGLNSIAQKESNHDPQALVLTAVALVAALVVKPLPDLEPSDGTLNVDQEMRGHLEFPVENLQSGNTFEDRELRRRID